MVDCDDTLNSTAAPEKSYEVIAMRHLEANPAGLNLATAVEVSLHVDEARECLSHAAATDTSQGATPVHLPRHAQLPCLARTSSDASVTGHAFPALAKVLLTLSD